MSDLIDRQAALDAIDAWRKDYPLDMQEPIDDCWNAVKELPTVQPEIIRCKDCNWWTKQKDSLQGRCELMQMYPTGRWYCGNARRRGGDSD